MYLVSHPYFANFLRYSSFTRLLTLFDILVKYNLENCVVSHIVEENYE